MSTTKDTKKASKQLFVEKRPAGDFAVKKAHAERASDVLPTQAEVPKN
jgi:hypothetical protein